MKKIFYSAASITCISFTLTACGGLTNAVDTTAHAVGSTVSFVATPVVYAVDGSVNLLTGQTASQHDIVVYKKKGVVHKHGHTYRIVHGKYVLVR